MDFRRTSKAIVIGDGEGRVAEFGGAGDEIIGVGSPVEEAVVRVCVELRVSCHELIVIERMFDVLRVAQTRQNQGVDDELTPDELEQIRRRRLVRAVIVVAVVLAMVATLLFPVLVRIVQAPREPDTVIAMRAEVPCRTMDS